MYIERLLSDNTTALEFLLIRLGFLKKKKNYISNICNRSVFPFRFYISYIVILSFPHPFKRMEIETLQ